MSIGILIFFFQTLEFWSYSWDTDPFCISVGLMILSLETLEFCPYFCTLEFLFYLCRSWYSSPIYSSKQWNSGSSFIRIGITILFFQTFEFWPCFIHNGILTWSFETMAFWPYCYKHLPLILSFHCNNWNSCPKI